MILEVVGSIIASLSAGIALHFITINIRNPIRIKRIMSSSDPLVIPTLELYQSLFPQDDGTNYGPDEFIENMNSKSSGEHHIKVENIVFVALYKDTVVGFIFAHFYQSKRKAIISYFAVNKEVNEARVKGAASKKLLNSLKKVLFKSRTCDVLFYDVERISQKSPSEERKRKIGRAATFKMHAKALGLEAREFQFLYKCPKVTLSEFAHEKPFILFCIGISYFIPKVLSKKELLEFLRFVYLDCYGDTYEKNDPRFEEHQRYLNKLVDHYEKILPDSIIAT